MRCLVRFLTENVVHGRHHPHDLRNLASFSDPCRLVSRLDLEHTLAGATYAAKSAARIGGELLGAFPCPGRCFCDHLRLEVVESSKDERWSTHAVFTA